MKKIFLFLFTFVNFFINAQDQDPKAKAILDEVSKLTKSYKTIQADVMFSVIDKDKKPVDKSQAWKIYVKDQKFRLEIPGTTIVCDGKTLWNYNKDAKEVTIRNYDPDNEEQNLSKIFTIYETGYKFKYDKEEKNGLMTNHVIDLYPTIKPEKKKFHTVKLYVDKGKKQVQRLKMLMKDGGVQIYEMRTFKTNVEMPDNSFVFDTKGMKSDQINDERD
jgi:outer membrane lipoprotein carrier protein